LGARQAGKPDLLRDARALASEGVEMIRRLTASFAVTVAILMQPAASRADEAAAIKAIKKAGGVVAIQGTKRGQVRSTGVNLERAKYADAGIKELKEISNLQWLVLKNFTGAGLQLLGSRKDLQELTLTGNKVTDASLREIKGLTGLRHLDLTGTGVTDDGVRELKDLQSLVEVDLGNTKITDGGLKDLSQVKGLRRLFLFETRIGDAGLRDLANLENLHTLSLTNTNVTDAGLKALKNVKSLRSVVVRGTKVTNEGVLELQEANPILFIGR
jgi:internalin A